MILFNNLTLRQGTTNLLENANAMIAPGQKVGLVGKNGCGKSSLLSLLKKTLSPESGDISLPKDWQLAWVNQETPALDISALDYCLEGDRRYCELQAQLAQANAENNGEAIAHIHSALDEIDAWTIQARASTLLNGLGFSQEELTKPVKSFSGGWRMRLNLAQALLCRSDLLLLDEPTNHLDLDAVIWLERYLTQYAGTLILISHDRDFLDPIVDKILHIEQQKLHEYTGDYSSFERQRATKLAQQNALHRQQQMKISHLQSYINRFKAKATKAKQAQSRVKALEKMELIAAAHVDSPFKFTFREPLALPHPLLTMREVSAGYENAGQTKVILENIQLNLVPGSRIGLLGKNGAGKSTLIKLLAGKIPPLSGTVALASGVVVGYFAQHQLDNLRADESPLWHLQQLSPELPEQALRDYLGGFAFQGDKVLEPVKDFSGGEKARLALALIVWSRPNLLLLDEPTNHLDLDMRQALTEALVDFEGSVVVVSHDRHLLRNTVDEFYLVDAQQVAPFAGDLSDYQRWLTEVPETPKAESTVPVENDRKAQKRKAAELRQQVAPLRKNLARLEQTMEKVSAELAEVENQLNDQNLYEPQNKAQLADVLQRQRTLRDTLTATEDEWFLENEKIEEILSE